MPSFANLGDENLAAVAAFLHASTGGDAAAVAAREPVHVFLGLT